ncbi:ABC transporter substrate-binding protein [Streptomyces sp. NBC_01643]|uniref:ABC transporter substrate-binding protein n=1 Tax=Streptomyces sp. NBC_01643 TaxID=2975906 RepID=UPI002F90A366|nr:ABC transporter substrate-binding protein [Streptomyces sp. NBC_01643]
MSSLLKAARWAATIASLFILLAVGALGLSRGSATHLRAGELTVAMTASDIPNLDTTLSFDQGYEGLRFVGFQLYDGLTGYDLTETDRTPALRPALATSWQHNKAGTSWAFHLRHGVRFHDNTPFNANAVVFNLDRYLNKQSRWYYPELAAQSTLAISGIHSYRKIDDTTVRIDTNGPWSHLPEDLTLVFMASPTAVKAHGNHAFADHPVGTGPFKFHSVKRGQQLILDANRQYWYGSPRIDRLVLRPMPDELSRVAALRAGEVNWAEAPGPDNTAALRSDGHRVVTNAYDHIWPWLLDTSRGPLHDKRVRQALNYAINRPQMTRDLLRDTADVATQLAPPASTAHTRANDRFTYDPARARRLLEEAGYPRGFTMGVAYPTGGSGNMQPAAMNEEIRSDLARVGVRVQLHPVEWAALLGSFLTGKIPDNANALNMSLTFAQELMWPTLFHSHSPLNVSHYANADVDKALGASLAEPDPARRAAIYARIVHLIDADAPWLVVVNDRNPRALANSVHGFIQPKSWFVDLTHLTVT